jgi:hypothetical protein
MLKRRVAFIVIKHVKLCSTQKINGSKFVNSTCVMKREQADNDDISNKERCEEENFKR